MKRALMICSTTILAGVFLYACGIIPNEKTSVVTVTIGDNPNKAVLRAEAATPWTRVKHFLAEVDLVSEANAYIPSVVQVIIVTVTGADIATPIVGVRSVKDTDTTVSIRVEVPNGSGRTFLVEGYRGIDSQVYYRGTATADLAGTDVTLPVNMSFVGPGIWVSPTGNDTTGTGTQVNPYLTISKALSTTTGTDAILVTAGTFTLTAGAAPALLELKPANALLCLGPNFTTVLDASSETSDLMYGEEGASIDNCKLIPGSDTTAIDDRNGAQTPTRIKVNGVLIDADQVVGGALDGIMLYADSIVLETTVLNTTWHGITVRSGKPVIQNSTISLNPIGIEVADGEPEITGNTIADNSTGINFAGAGKPKVSANTFTQQSVWNGTAISVNSGGPLITGNTIRDHNIGIMVGDASPEVTGNTITKNWIGIDIATAVGGPRVNGNSIFCNDAHDVGVFDPLGLLVFDLRNNSWDHDTATTPSGPVVMSGSFSNLQGDDIFASSPTPTPQYIPFNTAVPRGCLPPVGVGKPSVK